jgi:hypothetical protein
MVIFYIWKFNAILEVFEEVLDVTLWDTQRVNPHFEDSFFLAAFWIIIIEHFCCCEIFFGGCKSRTVIEDLGTEHQVHFAIGLQRV